MNGPRPREFVHMSFKVYMDAMLAHGKLCIAHVYVPPRGLMGNWNA